MHAASCSLSSASRRISSASCRDKSRSRSWLPASLTGSDDRSRQGLGVSEPRRSGSCVSPCYRPEARRRRFRPRASLQSAGGKPAQRRSQVRAGRLRAARRAGKPCCSAASGVRRLALWEAPGEPREQRPGHATAGLPRPEGAQTERVAPERARGAVGIAVVNQRRSSTSRLRACPARPCDAQRAKVRVRASDDHPPRLVSPALAVVNEQHSTLCGQRLRAVASIVRARGAGLGGERGRRDDPDHRALTRSRHASLPSDRTIVVRPKLLGSTASRPLPGRACPQSTARGGESHVQNRASSCSGGGPARPGPSRPYRY
jgi:hypothetical protein